MENEIRKDDKIENEVQNETGIKEDVKIMGMSLNGFIGSLLVLFTVVVVLSYSFGNKSDVKVFNILSDPEYINSSTGLNSSTGSFNKENTITFLFTGSVKDGKTFEVSTEPVTIKYGNEAIPLKLQDEMLGLKKGDKKTIALTPEEGFGGKTVEKMIPKEAFADVIEQTLPSEFFKDTIYRTLPDQSGSGITVGTKLDMGNGIEAEVISMSGGLLSVKIENVVHPFKDMELKVGAKDVYGSGGTIEILAIEDDNIKVRMDNILNPFWKKKIEVGSKTNMLEGSGSIEIVKITDQDITLRYDNKHPLADKNIVFEISVEDIK